MNFDKAKRQMDNSDLFIFIGNIPASEIFDKSADFIPYIKKKKTVVIKRDSQASSEYTSNASIDFSSFEEVIKTKFQIFYGD